MLNLSRSWLQRYDVAVVTTLAVLLTLLLNRLFSMGDNPLLPFLAVVMLSAWYSSVGRKQQEALRQSEEQLQSIVDNSPAVVYLKDTQGRYLLINRKLETVFNITKEEIIGKTDYEIFPKDIAENFTANDQKVLTSLKSLEFEEVAPHDDGLHTYISVKFLLYNSSTGFPYAICGISTDITKRKQAEAALSESEERFALFMRNLPGVAFIKDSQCRHIFVNQTLERIFHWQANSWQGQTNEELFSPEIASQINQNDLAVLKEQNILETIEFIPQDDGIHYYLVNKFPLWDKTGNPMIGGIGVDITLISDEVLKQLPDAIVITDLEGNIQKWLGKAEQIFGYSAKEAIGKPVNFLHRPDIKEIMTLKIIQDIKETGLFFGEIPCLRKNGSEVPIETTAKTLYDKTGKPLLLVGINRDITERKIAESERAQRIREQAVRVVTEAAEQRSAFIAEVSSVLASSLDYNTTLESVAQLAVPYLADWCAVDIFDEEAQSIRRVALAHLEQSKVELGWELNRRYPENINAARGVPKILRTCVSEIASEIPDSTLVAVAQDAEHLHSLRELGLKSCIVVPLVARGRSLGVISFVTSESDRRYDAADLSLAEELARRAALAVDNARLYSEAQEARKIAELAADRTIRLQKVTAALSESLTPEQVADVIVEQGMAAIGANCALVALLTADGTQLEIVRAIGYKQEVVEAWRYFPIDAPVPLAEVVRTGEPAWLESKAKRLERYPHLAETYSHYEFEAWLSMPLIVGGQALGGISLGFNKAQELSEDDRAFMLTVAQQGAQAIARSQLYESEQAARASAEAGSLMKDEFLAVLSHELRTPLNAILGWSKLLRTRKFDEATTVRALETIERNAKLQSQLIEDILDVSRIIRGKLRLNISPINLLPVIESAIDAVLPSSNAKSIQLESRISPSVGLVAADSARLQQVIWNLLSNAIKFTPDGGQVTLEVTTTESHVQIQIRDTGKGISAEFLPYVFERFSQADSTASRSQGGLGLGLAIVRQLVELHGGMVSADSLGEGQGATFTVQLPLVTRSSPSASNPLGLDTITPSHLNNLQVLVVDDETDAREFITTALEQYGARVEAIASASEAIEALKQLKPDVLISDIGMPGEDGYALICQVRSLDMQQGGQVPAVALTAYAREEDRIRALGAGFQMHVPKPVEPADLARVVAQLAGRI